MNVVVGAVLENVMWEVPAENEKLIDDISQLPEMAYVAVPIRKLPELPTLTVKIE